MQEKGFWDDIKRAEEVTKESKSIKDKIDRYESLVRRLDDVEVLAELAEDDEETGEFKLDLKELFLLAIATSIDALAVGITFAFLNYPIVECMSIIGCTTFIISFIGVYIGKIFGSKYEHKAEIAGGIILIVIGLKILLEHLGIF